MKTLIFLLFIFNTAFAGIPDWVGRSNAPTPKWASYIGNGYVVSVAHWAPRVGEIITFQDGQSSRVAGGWRPRRGPYGGYEADVWVGWLETPVSTEPVEVWWKDPNLPETFEVEGVGLKNNRLITWSAQARWWSPEDLEDHFWKEWGTGVWFYCPSDGEVRPGYSGAPVTYQGKLLGCIGAGGWDLPQDHWLLPSNLPPSCLEVGSITAGGLNPWFWIKQKWPTSLVYPNHRPIVNKDGSVWWKSPIKWTLETSIDLKTWEDAIGTYPISGKRFFRLKSD